MVGIKPQGLVIVGNCTWAVLLRRLSVPVIVVRAGVVGIEPQGLVIVGNCTLIIA